MDKEKSRQEKILDQFHRNTQSHVMEIILDEKDHRHLRFKRPGSSSHHFDIVTYPGYLVYSGDMGAYVFSRLRDMFDFFRTDGDELSINVGYWSEKLQAVDCQCGLRGDGRTEWDDELHNQWVKEQFDEWKKSVEEDGDYDESDFRSVWNRLEGQVMHADNEWDAMDRIWNWCLNDDGDFSDRSPFSSEWYESYSAKQPPSRLIWCLYALNWGIKQYDKHHADIEARKNDQRAKLKAEKEEHDRLYIVYRDDVEGAPFKINQRVESAGVKGTVKLLDYSGGCGESFPDDPMICVQWDASISDGDDEPGRGYYWKEEIKAVDDEQSSS